MRTNLGLGSAALATDGVAANNIPHIDATFTAGDSVFATALGLQTKTAAATRTALSLVVGTNVQAYDATLQSLSSLGTVTDRIAYTTALDTWAEATFTAFARTLVANNSAADARVDLDVLNGYGLLASSDAIDLNSATTDTAVTIGATRYLIDNITLESPSAAVTTATMGLFTAAGGGGTTLCADQALSGSLTATTKVMNLVKQAIVDSDSRTDGTLYIRVGTAEGSACTVNVKIYGWKFA